MSTLPVPDLIHGTSGKYAFPKRCSSRQTISPFQVTEMTMTTMMTMLPATSPSVKQPLLRRLKTLITRHQLAVDGSTTTRWSSSFSNNQYIYVDLGSAVSVSKVILKWEAAYGSAYKIQSSSDAYNWTDVANVTNGNGGTDEISFTAVTARYVRMYGITRATSYGFSLYEFEVYGPSSGDDDDDDDDVSGNLALGKTAAASSTESSSYPASAAVDGSTTTRWSSSFSNNQYIYVDLGSAVSVSKVILKWEAAYGYAYKIQTSSNAYNWTDVANFTNGNGGTDEISFTSDNGTLCKNVRHHKSNIVRLLALRI